MRETIKNETLATAISPTSLKSRLTCGEVSKSNPKPPSGSQNPKAADVDDGKLSRTFQEKQRTPPNPKELHESHIARNIWMVMCIFDWSLDHKKLVKIKGLKTQSDPEHESGMQGNPKKTRGRSHPPSKPGANGMIRGRAALILGKYGIRVWGGE